MREKADSVFLQRGSFQMLLHSQNELFRYVVKLGSRAAFKVKCLVTADSDKQGEVKETVEQLARYLCRLSCLNRVSSRSVFPTTWE